jgi:hypothetical protein
MWVLDCQPRTATAHLQLTTNNRRLRSPTDLPVDRRHRASAGNAENIAFNCSSIVACLTRRRLRLFLFHYYDFQLSCHNTHHTLRTSEQKAGLKRLLIFLKRHPECLEEKRRI